MLAPSRKKKTTGNNHNNIQVKRQEEEKKNTTPAHRDLCQEGLGSSSSTEVVKSNSALSASFPFSVSSSTGILPQLHCLMLVHLSTNGKITSIEAWGKMMTVKLGSTCPDHLRTCWHLMQTQFQIIIIKALLSLSSFLLLYTIMSQCTGKAGEIRQQRPAAAGTILKVLLEMEKVPQPQQFQVLIHTFSSPYYFW